MVIAIKTPSDRSNCRSTAREGSPSASVHPVMAEVCHAEYVAVPSSVSDRTEPARAARIASMNACVGLAPM